MQSVEVSDVANGARTHQRRNQLCKSCG